MLGPGAAKQRCTLAIHQHGRAQVQTELQVEALGRNLGERLTNPGAGVVDEHVQSSVRLTVGGHRGLHASLLR
jgi:hypothetical protein